MVLPTSITRQRSFRPQSPTAYGPSGLHHLLRSVRPTSPDNGLSDPSFLSTTGLRRLLWSFRPPSTDHGLSDPGNVICFGLFLSPVPTFVEICRKKSVEQFSSIPYLAALANCMLWVFYGLPVVQPDTILISTINGVGVFVVIIYLTIFFFYSPKETRVKLLAILAGEVVLMAMVVTLVLTVVHTHDVRSLIVGILSIIFCVCMYASPLSVMV
ncbi:hypothetical protein KFK09_004722 [Dendrobium nobile]|uniref:Bidirectional sugar transporter SWEET n=1 Tax=Dendrobium nobile TaxID=94219 RepID=A0A8T3BTR7_DENNO|nr:hypothetical protein KFK09_004722 [Dendrobium nobile]